jgi:hypothetical protein
VKPGEEPRTYRASPLRPVDARKRRKEDEGSGQREGELGRELSGRKVSKRCEAIDTLRSSTYTGGVEDDAEDTHEHSEGDGGDAEGKLVRMMGNKLSPNLLQKWQGLA